MSYGTKYITSYSNNQNQQVDVYLDFLGYQGPSMPLSAADQCVVIKSTGGDEDKSASILGTECAVRLRIMPTDNVSIDDLVASHDNDIRVTVYLERNYSNPIFQGFVVVEDNSQPILDPPFVIQIRALDCLGLLKGIYFLDTNGNAFSGKMSIIGWLAQILNQTGQTLNLRVYFNIFHSSHSTNISPLDQTYLSAVTFMTGQQTPAGDTNPADFNTGFDDYYTVLQKIVSNFKCRIFQEGGYWHLVSLYEYLNPKGYTYYEYAFSVPVNGIIQYAVVGSGLLQNYNVSVGKKETTILIKEDGQIYLKIATKSFELTYNYNQSLNKVDNQNLSQTGPGNRQPANDEVIASNFIDVTINPVVNLQTIAYAVAGFIQANATVYDPVHQTPYPALPITTPGFIRIVQDQLGYEMQRFLVLPAQGVNAVGYFKGTKLLIDLNDIFQLTFSWRSRVNVAVGGRLGIAWVLLYGDDGTFWALSSLNDGNINGNPTSWRQCDSNFNEQFQNLPNLGAPFIQTGNVSDSTQWTTTTANTNSLNDNAGFAKAPVSGEIEVMFIWEPGVVQTELWVKDISIQILPYLNGSYLQLKGDYNFAESNNNILQTFSDVVDISDSPKRYFAGALLGGGNGFPLLSSSWKRIDYTEALRFTQIMDIILYTLFSRIIKKIEGSLRGLVYRQTTSPYAIVPTGFLNTYLFLDTSTPDKCYMLTSFEKDYSSGQWRGVFVETRKDANDLGLIMPDLFTFAYLLNSG